MSARKAPAAQVVGLVLDRPHKMPDKITPKNLSYDQTLPPFLARLRGQQNPNSLSPDPILAARRRPGRIRTASEEAEDAPVVVDEEGNVVQLKTGELDEDGQSGAVEQQTDEPSEERGTGRNRTEPEKEKVAGIGAAKKRKVGRIVGGDEDETDGTNRVDSAIAKAVSATRKLAKDPPKEEPKPAANASEKGGKKKAKKVKLSFGDDEG